MEAILQTPFNTAQVEILQLFSQSLTDTQVVELRRLLIDFRFKRLDEHVEKVAKEKGLSAAQITQSSHTMST